MNLLIAKNGIDWTAMGFTVYGECPEYGSTKKKRQNIGGDKTRNISFIPSYKLWSRLIQIDRGNVKGYSGILCEEWKQFETFEKWYNENFYKVENDNMNFSFRFFDVHNEYITPETSCFLPYCINNMIGKIISDDGLLINVNKQKTLYKIRLFDDYIAYSDSKEEINEIRKQILYKQFIEFAETYKKELPERIYNRLLHFDFDEVNDGKMG